MMLDKAQPTQLQPLQTRVIHASAGMRLRVVSGRLWLTQPNAEQDLFLGPGSVVDLVQDWVVIGADAQPRGSAESPALGCAYCLEPMGTFASRQTDPRGWVTPARQLLRQLRRLVRTSTRLPESSAR